MSGKRTPGDYVFLEQLGQGSYSTVFRAVERTNGGRNYAIKVCGKKHIIREKKVKYVTIEKDLLNNLARGGHPGIVRLFCTFHDAENLYFVLEYVSGGELLSLLRRNGPLPESWSKHLFAQLVDTVDYMHAQGVIHRDLKPENVLLSQEGRIVITDFGAACALSNSAQDRAASFVGTAEYVAPELLLYSQCGLGSDVWALGCILYQLTQGAPPFRGENELKTFEQIVALDYKWKIPTTPQITALVRNILVLDPMQRPSSKQLKQNSWFSSIDWNDRATLWKGIWELPERAKNEQFTLRRRSPTQSASPAIETPMSGVRVTRRKPAAAKSTSAIVEWRKQLGLGSLPSPPPSAGNLAFTPKSQVPSSHLPRPKSTDIVQSSPQPSPSSSSSSSAPSIAIASTPLIKRDIVSILEIPFNASEGSISLNSYSNVHDSIITEFVARNKSAILERSLNCIMALDVKGQLSSQGPRQPVRNMVSVSDPDLSMYDFEFDETNNSGFLILEKYKSKLWFLSAALLEHGYPMNFRPLNKDKSWIDSFFTARKIVTDAEGAQKTRLRPASSSSTVSTGSSTNPAKAKPKTSKHTPSKMLVSSSRYEVLHALSSSGMKSGDATRGASAAFNSLRKR
ncbi:LANO_0H11606g1_1 [Lachancea nothofagi CBS 11611]|uniref:non-specific serine/threonine protein kinase n=1 Tax=Lachancea nothofagi CBS 11611 TaxID=1266666 RepID=A0A1G4KMJ7_9SACH|nr:LANO_0H11606g1_1 [Lachancea nothofagi CBS 11611]